MRFRLSIKLSMKKISYFLFLIIFISACSNEEPKEIPTTKIDNKTTQKELKIYDWTSIRPIIMDTVRVIEAYDYISNGIVGIAGKEPKQWSRRKWFKKNATKEELLLLKDYPNGAVKATVYEALIPMQKENQFELVRDVFKDTTTSFVYQTGRVSETMMLGEYIAESILYISDKVPAIVGTAERMGFSKEEIRELKRLYDVQQANKERYLNDLYE